MDDAIGSDAFTLFTTGPLVGPAFVAMGTPHTGPTIPTGIPHEIPAGKLALGSFAGDFQLVAAEAPAGQPTRVTNKELPVTPTPYVILDGGGDRFGGNVFLARNANTNGQFLFIMTEGGPGGGVGAHFHARHFENFYGFDGETLGWAQGKAVPLHTGDYFQTPPRHLHGFRLNQAYNRFAAFLTPGIFEPFFVRRRRTAGARVPARARGGRAGAHGGRAGGDGAPGRRARTGHVPLPADERPRFGRLSARRAWREARRCRRRIRSGCRDERSDGVPERAALLAHAQLLCGVPVSREITPSFVERWRSNLARWISCERATSLDALSRSWRSRARPRAVQRRTDAARSSSRR